MSYMQGCTEFCYDVLLLDEKRHQCAQKSHFCLVPSRVVRKGNRFTSYGGYTIYVQGTCFLNKIIILVLNYLLSLPSIAFAFRDRSLGE